MDASSIKAMMAEIAPVVREYFDAGIAPLLAENKALAARVAELEVPVPAPMTAEEVRAVAAEEAQTLVAALPEPEAIPDIASVARDAAAEQLAAFAATFPAPIAPDEEAIAARVLESLPTPEKGDTGEVDMDEVRTIIDEMTQQTVIEQVAEAVKAIPAPEPVEPIAPDMEAIAKLISEGIAKAAAELPKPKKGEDGIGLADALIDKDGQLVLTMTNGTTKSLGVVVGKDGETPPPFTLDDFDVEPVDERTIRLGFTKGTEKHTFELAFPVLIGRGIWSAEGDYERGDVTTWGGTAWEAVEPVKGIKPDASSGGWRILAKRGRDGKAGK